MAYMQKKWVSHDKRFIVVDKYHSLRALPKNTQMAKEKRKPRQGITSEQQEKINLRHRTDKLSRLIMDNFKPGDWWVAFTLEEKVSVEKFKTAYEKMIRYLRGFYQKHGLDFKYVAVQENLTGRGRLHGHMMIPAIPGVKFEQMKKMVDKAWTLGHTYFKPYVGSAMDARRVAAYMTKEDTITTKLNEKMQARRAGIDTKALDSEIKAQRSLVCTSKNLIRTKAVKTRVSRGTFRKEVKAPKGYHVVFSYNGNTKDNFDYQHAIFERDDE